jgi:hypothetical protein
LEVTATFGYDYFDCIDYFNCDNYIHFQREDIGDEGLRDEELHAEKTLEMKTYATRRYR